MEARKFKLQQFSRTARYLHSVKSVATTVIGTFISASLAKMTPDPPPYHLKVSDPSRDLQSERSMVQQPLEEAEGRYLAARWPESTTKAGTDPRHEEELTGPQP